MELNKEDLNITHVNVCGPNLRELIRVNDGKVPGVIKTHLEETKRLHISQLK